MIECQGDDSLPRAFFFFADETGGSEIIYNMEK